MTQEYREMKVGETKAAVELILSNVLCRIESERGKEGERGIRGRGGVGEGKNSRKGYKYKHKIQNVKYETNVTLVTYQQSTFARTYTAPSAPYPHILRISFDFHFGARLYTNMKINFQHIPMVKYFE